MFSFGAVERKGRRVTPPLSLLQAPLSMQPLRRCSEGFFPQREVGGGGRETAFTLLLLSAPQRKRRRPLGVSSELRSPSLLAA